MKATESHFTAERKANREAVHAVLGIWRESFVHLEDRLIVVRVEVDPECIPGTHGKVGKHPGSDVSPLQGDLE